MKLDATALAWVVVFLATLTAGGLVGGAAGQRECPSTFFAALLQLIPCRPAVAPFSPSPPSEACCMAVRMLGPPCLCVIVNGPPISGVDRDLAMQLPVTCSIDYEPCKILGIPRV